MVGVIAVKTGHVSPNIALRFSISFLKEEANQPTATFLLRHTRY
jgi:hypothetical protein